MDEDAGDSGASDRLASCGLPTGWAYSSRACTHYVFYQRNEDILIIPGTEDLGDSYKDYKFHAIGSLKGMVIGLPVCTLVGIMVQVIKKALEA